MRERHHQIYIRALARSNRYLCFSSAVWASRVGPHDRHISSPPSNPIFKSFFLQLLSDPPPSLKIVHYNHHPPPFLNKAKEDMEKKNKKIKKSMQSFTILNT